MKPGDIVENGWASKDNPLWRSIVIKDKGEIVICTDGKGGIWDSPKGPKLKVIGHVTLSPVGQDRPDYKAMFEDLETDFNDTYAWQLSTRTERLKDILKKVRAKHTPQPGAEKEKCPVCSGEGMTRKPLALGRCDRCGGTGKVNRAGAGTEKPEGKDGKK